MPVTCMAAVDKLKILAKIAKLDAAELAIALFSGEQSGEVSFSANKNGRLPVFNVFYLIVSTLFCRFFDIVGVF